MRAGEAVLECVFEVDVNGILKVTATEKTSGRSANITISNTVGKLSSAEIENMVSGMYRTSFGSYNCMKLTHFARCCQVQVQRRCIHQEVRVSSTA